MAGCKTWQGKLTRSFPFERVATLGERRVGCCVKKKKRGRACVKELKKQNVSHPRGEQRTMLSVEQEEDNRLTRSQAYTHYQERAEQ